MNIKFEFVNRFCEQSVKSGMDIFRVFDCLNYLPNLLLGMEAAGKAGGVVEGSVCYTGDITDPSKTKYSLDYYMKLVDELVKGGTHIIGIKDMAGVLKPEAATILIGSIKDKYPHLPIHLHTHDTAGAGVATYLAAIKAGANIVDVAADAMSGMTSQPSMGAVVACLDNSPLSTGMSLDTTSKYSAFWEQTRSLYGPFECTATMKSGNADVYNNEIPGGQYTNLQFQSFSLGLADQFEEVKHRYSDANELLGNIVKVTPSSKIVGDLAQFMVQNKLTKEEVLEKASDLNFPSSVVEYFQGLVGVPPGGFPEPLRSRVLRGKKPLVGENERPGQAMEPLNFDQLHETLKSKFGHEFSEKDLLSAALYPKVFEDFEKFRNGYGPVGHLETKVFLRGPQIAEEIEVELERGKRLHITCLAMSDISATGHREVFFELNGQLRSVHLKDKNAKTIGKFHPKCDPGNNLQVGCPMPGEILEVRCKQGEKVKKGDVLLTLSAMKMELIVSAPIDGTIKTLLAKPGMKLDGEDLLLELEQ
ncbi:hypothetical protein Ciccas_010373 [Cichlidogyrus casuarinus]|uniref:Pyruvate carboxylase n=1 Tax=Cichlidogyrus casuarinus TaxID=1844966 RepID=A0ABD2PVF0_9PLAT